MMNTPLKNGCYPIKTTKKYEVYQLGEKIFKYIYKSLKIKKINRCKGYRNGKLLIK